MVFVDVRWEAPAHLADKQNGLLIADPRGQGSPETGMDRHVATACQIDVRLRASSGKALLDDAVLGARRVGRVECGAKAVPFSHQWWSRGMPLVSAMRWYLTAGLSTIPFDSSSTRPRWISCHGVWLSGYV